MGTIQFQLDDLCDKVRRLLESDFGTAAQRLVISTAYCGSSEDAPWEIQVQDPCGNVHGFAGADAENAVHNLERFGMRVIGRGLRGQSSEWLAAHNQHVQSA